MIVLVLAAGLLAALPGMLTCRMGGGHPRTWALVASTSLLAAGFYVLVGLALLAAPVLLLAAGGTSVTQVCEVLVQRFEPGGLVTAWLAAGLLGSGVASTAWRLLRSRRRRMTLRVPSYVGVHEPHDGFELVTLPTEAALAYSVAGRGPQVVIARGLRARLDEGQLAAVVAHEYAHLRRHHQRWLDAIDASTGLLWFVPWARRCARAARVALECWADREAAEVADPCSLRDALLVAADAVPAHRAVASLNGADALVQRIAMLDGDHGRRDLSASTLSLLAFTAVVATAGAVSAGPQLAVLFSHLCPL
ncbi:MAG TPA: M56 family metallopeptidase [Thermoanaerobaculaceae bacterium]|nr:MAG: hypothetical protein B7Z69_08485 [Actinobacteria bacterium 21-73-9]HQU33961.1 M56 family metallopeptidase [Thermoanaerobaculaceae bacterium]